MKKYQISWKQNKINNLHTLYIYLTGGIISNACQMQYKDYMQKLVKGKSWGCIGSRLITSQLNLNN